MEDLERQLQAAQEQRFRVIVTDGVFSMDGNVAPIDKICDLAEKYDALVMVDESHSAGVVGPTGHGVSEFFNTYGRVDIYTGTLGKAFGGAMGGFTTGRKEIIDMLRQRSRPYLFSNSVAPAIVGAALETFKILKESNDIHDKLKAFAGLRCQASGRGHLRDRLLLSRCAEGPGPYPCADFCRTRARTPRQVHRRLHQGGQRTGRPEISRH